jgi:uncharacterized membrane protein
VLRRFFGPFFIFAGVMHFARPRWYTAIMPDYLPAHRELVYASGVAEIAGGLGTLHPATRQAASWWSIATLIAVFPANVHMAMNLDRYKDIPGGRNASSQRASWRLPSSCGPLRVAPKLGVRNA